MALEETTVNGGVPATMLVGPAGYGSNNSGFGGDWAWIILLLLLGWGNNGFGNRGIGGNGQDIYPWMNQANLTSDGFQNQMLNDNMNEIRNGVTSLAAQMSNGFNAANIANLERSFSAQTAATQASNALQAQLAQCCCDNRLATAQLAATISQENCADREALNYATRDIINGQNAGIQRILDQLCNDKIDAKNEKIADLERQLTMANLAASQGAQTAQILANNAAQTSALEQYLAPVPRPAYIVANPNGCQQSTCGVNCGCPV